MGAGAASGGLSCLRLVGMPRPAQRRGALPGPQALAGVGTNGTDTEEFADNASFEHGDAVSERMRRLAAAKEDSPLGGGRDRKPEALSAPPAGAGASSTATLPRFAALRRPNFVLAKPLPEAETRGSLPLRPRIPTTMASGGRDLHDSAAEVAVEVAAEVAEGVGLCGGDSGGVVLPQLEKLSLCRPRTSAA